MPLKISLELPVFFIQSELLLSQFLSILSQYLNLAVWYIFRNVMNLGSVWPDQLKLPCVLNKKKKLCYCLNGKKSHKYSERLFHPLFSRGKHQSAVWERSLVHCITPLSLSVQGTSKLLLRFQFLDNKLTCALVQHQKSVVLHLAERAKTVSMC